MTRPGPVITDRDREILRSLEEYRLLTTEQVQRLHFPSPQTTLRRLRRLETEGLVLRQRSNVLTTHAVTLTPRGAAVLRNGDDGAHACGGSASRTVRLPGEFFLRHMVAVNDFRIALEQDACRRHDVELLGAIADTERSAAGPAVQPRAALAETVAFDGERGERLLHVPDLAFALRRDGRQALFLVEVDRGTEVVGDPKRGVGRFVRFYLRALLTGGFQGLGARFGGETGFKGFRVLVVTTSKARVESIRARWGTLPVEPEVAKKFIWLSTSEAICSSRLLEHEWVSLDHRDEQRYVIAPCRAEGTS
jgi:DNA-binding MarR family transcriptional regulator